MSDDNQKTAAQSDSTHARHAICRNSPTPEKCEIFAERLEQAKSNISIGDRVAVNLQADQISSS